MNIELLTDEESQVLRVLADAMRPRDEIDLERETGLGDPDIADAILSLVERRFVIEEPVRKPCLLRSYVITDAGRMRDDRAFLHLNAAKMHLLLRGLREHAPYALTVTDLCVIFFADACDIENNLTRLVRLGEVVKIGATYSLPPARAPAPADDAWVAA